MSKIKILQTIKTQNYNDLLEKIDMYIGLNCDVTDIVKTKLSELNQKYENFIYYFTTDFDFKHDYAYTIKIENVNNAFVYEIGKIISKINYDSIGTYVKWFDELCCKKCGSSYFVRYDVEFSKPVDNEAFDSGVNGAILHRCYNCDTLYDFEYGIDDKILEKINNEMKLMGVE